MKEVGKYYIYMSPLGLFSGSKNTVYKVLEIKESTVKVEILGIGISPWNYRNPSGTYLYWFTNDIEAYPLILELL